MDNGYPLTTEPNALKAMIRPPTTFVRMVTAATGKVIDRSIHLSCGSKSSVAGSLSVLLCAFPPPPPPPPSCGAFCIGVCVCEYRSSVSLSLCMCPIYPDHLCLCSCRCHCCSCFCCTKCASPILRCAVSFLLPPYQTLNTHTKTFICRSHVSRGMYACMYTLPSCYAPRAVSRSLPCFWLLFCCSFLCFWLLFFCSFFSFGSLLLSTLLFCFWLLFVVNSITLFLALICC